jgi:PTH1 family peptidyl-tRNA hydrolase
MIQGREYMNRTGGTLARLGIACEAPSLVVAHDDIDLPVGGLKLKLGGGSAGHRGIESIAERFGAAFIRVRLGVGRPSSGDVVGHVLGLFDERERPIVSRAVKRAADAVECILEDGIDATMARFNARSRVEQDPALDRTI